MADDKDSEGQELVGLVSIDMIQADGIVILDFVEGQRVTLTRKEWNAVVSAVRNHEADYM